MTVKLSAQAFAAIALIALLVLPGAASFASPSRQTDAGPAAEWVIPRPDLSALSETARAKIETMQGTLVGLTSAGAEKTNDLKEGFGLLGQLFHAFDLLDAAEVCYRNARGLAPDDPRWAYYQALALSAQGELEDAVGSYRLAIELAPDSVAAQIRLGRALFDLGRTEEAEASFEAALELDPDSAAAFFGLGQAAAATGEAQQAVDLFEEALARQPEATLIHYPLAQAYRRLGNTERAQVHLDSQGDRDVLFSDRLAETLVVIAKSTALEVVGDLAKAEEFDEVGFLGFVLSQFSRDPGAVEQLEKVIGHLESSGQGTAVQIGRIRYAIGGLLASLGRGGEAIPQFEQAIAADGGLHDARVKLGNALAREERFDEAIDAYTKTLEARPEATDLLLKRSTVYLSQDSLAEARADLERMMELAPQNLEGRLLLVGVFEQLGEGQAAVDTLAAGIVAQTDEPTKRLLHTALADVYRRLGQPEGSAREYLQALKIDQAHVPALSGLASLLLQLGYHAQAAQTFEKWVEQEPANIQARMGEATGLIMAQAYARASERLEAGLAVVPESLDLKDLLARHLAACPDRAVRDGDRALELALELFSDVPSLESMETVAMAYAQLNKHSDAIDWQKRLISQAGGEATEADLGRWRSNLALYERGEACCAAAN